MDILDARLDRLRGDALRERMAIYRPDMVGVTAMMNEREGAVEAARVAKDLWPGAPVVIGGPWASTAPLDTLEKTRADAAVVGEGENTIRDIARALSEGESLAGIPGVLARVNGDVVESEPRPPISDLDTLPYPAYDAIHVERYLGSWRNGHNKLRNTNRIMPLFTSRGCPYNCIFCHNLQGKKFRPRSPEHVLGEIELLVRKYGIKEIEISDDIFNFDLVRAKRIISGIIERNYKIGLSFPNGLRADRMDEELLDLLRKAGCNRICYAVESASMRIQKIVGKAINLDKTLKIIEYTARKGISVGAYFMFGFPGETLEDMEETIRFAVNSALHTATFSYLAPFPGTRVYNEYLPAREVQFRDYSELSVNLSAASDEEFSKIRKRAYRSFYFRPGVIRGNWRVTPKNLLLMRNVWAVARLVVQNYVRY